jgi:TRAP-type C4-dicarboxylate transport system permease large subunit
MPTLVRKMLPFLLLEVGMLLMLLLFPQLSIVPMKWLT